MLKPDYNIAENILLEFCTGYQKRDLPFLLNLFTKNIQLWRSGVDEYRVGHSQLTEQLQCDWSQSEAGQIKIIRLVPTTEHALWTAAICQATVIIDSQQHVFDDLRGTIVVEKENGIWRIAHMHASFPDYRNPENGSFPVNWDE